MRPDSLGEHQTRLIGAPADWNPETDGECGALSVLDRQDAKGHPEMVSRWVLDPGDLAKLREGAAVYLSILGRIHPVVSVYVGDPEPERAIIEGLDKEAGRETSPEVASIAGELMHLTPQQVMGSDPMAAENLAAKIREVAASALAQVTP